jgi:predicted  nucleic acid-binding Zn-ribbon protein
MCGSEQGRLQVEEDLRTIYRILVQSLDIKSFATLIETLQTMQSRPTERIMMLIRAVQAVYTQMNAHSATLAYRMIQELAAAPLTGPRAMRHRMEKIRQKTYTYELAYAKTVGAPKLTGTNLQALILSAMNKSDPYWSNQRPFLQVNADITVPQLLIWMNSLSEKEDTDRIASLTENPTSPPKGGRGGGGRSDRDSSHVAGAGDRSSVICIGCLKTGHRFFECAKPSAGNVDALRSALANNKVPKYITEHPGTRNMTVEFLKQLLAAYDKGDKRPADEKRGGRDSPTDAKPNVPKGRNAGGRGRGGRRPWEKGGRGQTATKEGAAAAASPLLDDDDEWTSGAPGAPEPRDGM